MPPRFLLPETVAHTDGVGAELAIERSSPLLLTLSIHRIVERESLEVSICGSTDGSHWRPLASFPQKSYCGTYCMDLDLGRHPDIRYLRAQWKMGRWVGTQRPLFGFDVFVEELKMQHAGAA
ncbi:MAG: hypothetical protein JO307_13980 [Bryobacterales bacterium]|nr:hypothetical protein [Bryobacterales bacterium]MBV9398610.1 hypothetical protein [Bryobacterales bacterium]